MVTFSMAGAGAHGVPNVGKDRSTRGCRTWGEQKHTRAPNDGAGSTQGADRESRSTRGYRAEALGAEQVRSEAAETRLRFIGAAQARDSKTYPQRITKEKQGLKGTNWVQRRRKNQANTAIRQ